MERSFAIDFSRPQLTLQLPLDAVLKRTLKLSNFALFSGEESIPKALFLPISKFLQFFDIQPILNEV